MLATFHDNANDHRYCHSDLARPEPSRLGFKMTMQKRNAFQSRRKSDRASGPWREHFAVDARIVNGARRTFHAERGCWPGGPKLIKNCDSHGFEDDALLPVNRKAVQCDIGQAGPRASLFRKFPEAVTLSNKRRSGCRPAAGVRPGAHVGNA